MLLHLLLLISVVLGAHAARNFEIINKCPATIEVFINGTSLGNLPAKGGSTKLRFLDAWNGFIYTSANGGNRDGTLSTKAGFFGANGYYYIVKDINGFNTGISITPTLSSCTAAICTSMTCNTAFQKTPSNFPSLKPFITPTPPYYACPKPPNTDYSIVFCPDGAFPEAYYTGPTAIHPNGNKKKCLDVKGAAFANGTPVQIYDCNETNAQKWIIDCDNAKIRLANTNYCLDAGTNPANGIAMKIWTCYDNLPAQSWIYQDDDRISMEYHDQCLDLAKGLVTNGNKVQSWQCREKNTNQVWTLG